MNGRTIGFHPQTQKLESPYVSITVSGSERVKNRQPYRTLKLTSKELLAVMLYKNLKLLLHDSIFVSPVPKDFVMSKRRTNIVKFWLVYGNYCSGERKRKETSSCIMVWFIG